MDSSKKACDRKLILVSKLVLKPHVRGPDPGAFIGKSDSGDEAGEGKTNPQGETMAYVTMKELLEAGVHFGHQTKRWNPKMKPYIFGARNGIYIIDLQKTVRMFRDAYDFIVDTTAAGKSVLFVGTKKQARESIYEEANRAEMFYVQNRWLGGMLTNFQTIKKSVDRLNYLNTIENDGSIESVSQKRTPEAGQGAPETGQHVRRYPHHDQTARCHFYHRSQK
jgi:hypothetical protein